MTRSAPSRTSASSSAPVAVSTQGKAPLVAAGVRAYLEKILPRELEQVIRVIAAEREKLLIAEPDGTRRLERLREVLASQLKQRGISLD